MAIPVGAILKYAAKIIPFAIFVYKSLRTKTVKPVTTVRPGADIPNVSTRPKDIDLGDE